ncbi:MAG: hypothetical protein MUE96_06275 [Bacteroidia bacterium]|jgi:hypothetical protein|nr:hypothetical protein [Bacteroidia bacterium]
MARKTWSEKYLTVTTPEVKRTDKKFADIPEGASMLIATPQIVDTYIKSIPKGKTADIKTMRNDLAAAHHSEYTCPVTSGIFLRIVAEKAYEEYQQGKKKITPFWRMISPQSPTAKKLTFGKAFLIQKRAEEGID